MDCVSHTGYLAHEKSESEAKVKSRHQNYSKQVVRNMEEKEIGTKGQKSEARPN